jgi:hypothetical protein
MGSPISMHPNEETSIRFFGDWSSPLSLLVQDAWFDSISMNHKIPNWLRYMEGGSGKKYRYFINNLISSIDNARYLEIGTWAGSTACSALYGNKVKTVCIDNWSEFGGPKDLFFANLDKIKSADIDFSFIESDFRKVDYSNIGKFNVYMFDGPHSEQDQYDGIAIAQPALDDEYVLIVDDYNGPGVRLGSQTAIKDLNLKIVSSIEILTRIDDVHPMVSHEHSDWHNGYFIAVVQKF